MRMRLHRNGVGGRWPQCLPRSTLAGKEGEKPMDRSIICGVDGSIDSQAALAVAIDLAARLRLRLVIANVVEPSQSAYAGAASFGGAMSQPRLPTTDQQEDVANELLTELSATMGLE